MNYTLNQLKIFLKVTQTQSITRASEELFLTQPAVSIQLKNFQEQFAVPLTEIIGRKLYITDFGKEIATAAERILNEVYAINYKTEAYKGQLAGRLKFAVVSTGKYILPYFLSDFMQAHERIDLRMDVTNKAAVLESLDNNEVDFALVSVSPNRKDIEHFDLLANKLYLVGSGAPQQHEKEKKIIQEFPLIYREKGSGTRQIMEEFASKNNLPLHKRLELSSNEAVKQAVLAGLGYSVMPLIGIHNELEKKELHIVPIKPFPIQTQWQLIWLKEKEFSPVASAYLSYLKKEKNAILKQKFQWLENFN